MSDDSKEREYAAVRALDLVRPAGSIDSSDYLAALDEAEKICAAQQGISGAGNKEATRPLPQQLSGVGINARYQSEQAAAVGFAMINAQNLIAPDFITYSSQGPGEIYCLRSLPTGTTHPTISLINEMNAALNEYAKARGFVLQYRERCGTQYKISTDVLQYYIVRSYGM